MSKKPRMVQVTDYAEVKFLLLNESNGSLDTPQIWLNDLGDVYADADELRAWRESQTNPEVAK